MRGAKGENRAEEEEERVGGGRCGGEEASVYSQTGCFGILSPG